MSDNILPFDLQVEIMKRLPIKSLIQFRSVSKPWKSLIDSSKFIAQAREGTGLYEAVIKNIDDCKELSTFARSSLGPSGSQKLVITFKEYKMLLNGLVVEHPAAKQLVLNARSQQNEFGDREVTG